MRNVTLYVCDGQWVYSHSVTQSKYLPAPDRSTKEPPPATQGDEVAVWTGKRWQVLPDRPPVPPSSAEIISQYSKMIQDMLDVKAQEFRYDNINNATGWAGEFPEADQLKRWAAACWRKSGEIEAAVLAGERPIPLPEEVLAEMPGFEEFAE